jgi:hypothetical protein
VTENEVAREVGRRCLPNPPGLGPGLFNSVYEAIVRTELEKRAPVYPHLAFRRNRDILFDDADHFQAAVTSSDDSLV